MQASIPHHGYSRLTVFLVLAAAISIIGAWLLLTQAGVEGKADAVGYAICHRIEERSFEAFGRPLPLCARCTGIYLGVMVGLFVFYASGRGRAGMLPNIRVLAVLAVFVGVMGIDGINSYFNLFDGYTGPYEPSNTLRLITGVFCGFALVNLVFPIFNQSIWENAGEQAPAIRNLKELAGLSLLGILAIVLMLVENATILLFLGLVSALGVLIVLTMIMTVMFVSVTQTFRTYSHWSELWLPLTAGLTMAIMMVGIIDYARYSVTGTWGGFVF